MKKESKKAQGMQSIQDELFHLILKHFKMHQARRFCFMSLILAMIGGCSVRLWNLAEQFGVNAQIASSVKRIKRFLKEQELCCNLVALLIADFLSPTEKLILAIDRTNWSFGKIERNYLVLAMVYKGSAVPILSIDLAHAGNSNYHARIALMERFLAIFGIDKIHCLIGDREFIGAKWTTWLHQNNIPVCVRVKNNMKIKHKNGGKVLVKNVLSHLKVDEYTLWHEKVDGFTMKMVALKRKTDDHLILMASSTIQDDLLLLYRQRWLIECAFKNLKTNGFYFEQTHLKHKERAEKMLSIAFVAIAILVREGVSQGEIKPIPFKKTLNTKAISIFKYGLQYLRPQVLALRSILTFVQDNFKNIIKSNRYHPIPKTVP